MFKSMIPNMYVQSIYTIDFHELQRRGIKSVIVDLDNTLVESTRPDATPRLIKWLDQVKHMGLQVMIVSNNTKTRVSQFAAPLNIPYIHTAKKPLSQAFRKALKSMGTKKEETVVIGDQLLTDVLGGNRMGLFTILVVPVSDVEGFFTRINRRIERFVFRWMEKRGLLRWEENH
ncbi:YqeG family HAD IIIA-type phosphatase [Paenactinomyces guangxiensis]|uniref:YqeG family HAD IIIA-type phosphatase n=1 Tax=Paenactinomyces guangxiensis TaxID=1490290 RepID=A0A7W1WNB7_9BACL|nr:YqeG family HAD IIIA-type phosphatase [Paenactinomyces guangxiensis]MBA4493073.1 YqeG family HAD IIIA-type phosphatase [Paenactinomyces guangxiensis]MBH8590077.1 YqeG family HAD IIIA-type phosphatase [Paenactinomyces guangxiensis]